MARDQTVIEVDSRTALAKAILSAVRDVCEGPTGHGVVLISVRGRRVDELQVRSDYKLRGENLHGLFE